MRIAHVPAERELGKGALQPLSTARPASIPLGRRSFPPAHVERGLSRTGPSWNKWLPVAHRLTRERSSSWTLTPMEVSTDEVWRRRPMGQATLPDQCRTAQFDSTPVGTWQDSLPVRNGFR